MWYQHLSNLYTFKYCTFSNIRISCEAFVIHPFRVSSVGNSHCFILVCHIYIVSSTMAISRFRYSPYYDESGLSNLF